MGDKIIKKKYIVGLEELEFKKAVDKFTNNTNYDVLYKKVTSTPNHQNHNFIAEIDYEDVSKKTK